VTLLCNEIAFHLQESLFKQQESHTFSRKCVA